MVRKAARIFSSTQSFILMRTVKIFVMDVVFVYSHGRRSQSDKSAIINEKNEQSLFQIDTQEDDDDDDNFFMDGLFRFA